MDFDAIYHFIFETYEGIGISIAAVLVLCVIAAFISEKFTKKKYVDRHTKEDEEEFFAEDDDE